MRDLVIHSASGLILDFAEEDFGGPEHAAVIAAWRDRGHHAEQGEFICHRHRNRVRAWLYLQQRGDLLVAAHWPGTALAGSHEISHGVSDEHKRQVEYVQRAGQAAGFEVRTEVSLPTKVRPDAIIYGPHQIGVEVQRSQLSAQAAKTRTTKAHYAGIDSLWFSERSDRLPAWFARVPSVAMMEQPWDTLPRSRSVTVTSVRIIVPKRCRDIRNGRCPNRRYGCDQWHAEPEPYAWHHREGILLDDVAERAPAGSLVPIMFRPFEGREYILIVPAKDKARYEAMIGRSADIPYRQRGPARLQQGTRIDCVVDAGAVLERRRQFAPWPAGATTQAPLVEIEGKRTGRGRKLTDVGQLYAALEPDDPRRWSL